MWPWRGVDGGDRLERADAVVLGLADADEDARGEGDSQLAGRLDASPDEPPGASSASPAWAARPGFDRLEHQALRSRDLPQAGRSPRVEHADVGMRQEPPVERLLAGPDDVGREVGVPVGRETPGDLGVDLGLLAGQHQQLLDPVADAPSRISRTSSGA